MRQHRKFFLTAVAAGIALRLIFIFFLSKLTNDSYIYGDIAKNWLLHGVYGVTDAGGISQTYIRLPGYPAFLAAIFWVFGVEHYRAVMLVQMLVDVGSCFLIADLARRVVSERAAQAAFWLAALCPFLADYVSAPLAETLEIFFTVLALDFFVAGFSRLKSPPPGERRMLVWAGCGLATGAAILLRPDGGLLLAAMEIYLGFRMARDGARAMRMHVPAKNLGASFEALIVIAICALAPLIPWTVRNWRTMHEFEPLAPRYATAPDEYVPMGFNRWVKTWIADYSSTESIYWNVPGAEMDATLLPSRAFDSARQEAQTRQVIDDYNKELSISPALDARFAALTAERIRRDPARYYLWLPALRIADMWLRPRTEKLPCNSRWWEFDEDTQWLALMIVLGVANLAYLAASVAGLVKGTFMQPMGVLPLFIVARSLFLGTLENPEPRYTLECYPVVIILAGTWLARFCPRGDSKSVSKKV